MDLKKKLDSIERTEIFYIAAGLLVVAVAAAGMQYQSTTPDTGEDQIQVSLTLEKPNETVSEQVDVAVNSTVFDAVNKTYPVEYTEYDFGYFVTSIDGLAQNDTHSWLYYVNNESATTAVNNYVLNETDDVTFRYTSNQPQ
jgi:hypothetical protein